VIWVFIFESFPNRHRVAAQALGSFTHWIFAALLTTFVPKMVTAFAPGYVFLFFPRQDGAATSLAEIDGAENERCAAGTNARAPRAYVAPP
jgi:hypothetical protein